MDLSEFQASDVPWRVCTVTHAMKKLDDEQFETVVEAFSMNSVTASRIAEVLSRWSGIKVTPSSARRHRRGECNCERSN